MLIDFLSFIFSIRLCGTISPSTSDNFKRGSYSILTSSSRYRFNYWIIIINYCIFEQESILAFLRIFAITINIKSNCLRCLLLSIPFIEVIIAVWFVIIESKALYIALSSLLLLFFFALLLLFGLYFRVMGLKLLPPLVLWGFMFFSSFFMLVLFSIIFFGENYLGRIVYAGAKLVFILLSSVEYLAMLSYSLLFVWSMVFVSMKAFLTVSMIVGNFIDVYILGIVAVLISFILYLIIFGILISSSVIFIFLSSLLMFLFILGLLELFSSLFASLTLSNRLSINMLCGSLLTSLLCSFLFAA